MNAQLELPIYDPSEPRIMPQMPGAFFTLNRLVPVPAWDGGTITRMRQTAYPLRLLADVVTHSAGQADTYMSQAIFDRPLRRAVHMFAATHAAVDLDCYNDAALALLPAPVIVRDLLEHCACVGIPPPSLIIASGRGYYAKWFWTVPIPRADAGRAVSVNRALVRAFAAFRADPAAVDMARILRICGTVNGKSGRPVEIVYLAGTQTEPLTYDFDTFANAILPPEVEAAPAGAAWPRPEVMLPRPALFTRENWHWTRLEDIRALAARRYPGGIVADGTRDIFGHLCACELAHVVPTAALPREIRTVCVTFLPAPFVETELPRTSATLMRRAAGAELVAFGGRLGTPIYGYSNARIIELLQITPDEERHMRALISPGEKARRHAAAERARRRAAGAMERADYEAVAAAASHRARVAELRARGMTWRAIGAELGISHVRAQQLAAG